MSSETETYSFAILGGGNGGTTIAGHLKLLGHNVRLYDVAEQQLQPIIDAGNQVVVEGNTDVTGTATLDVVSRDLGEVMDETVDMVLVVVPAFAHRFVAKDLAPHLTRKGVTVVFTPGGTGACLEASRVFKENGCPLDVDKDVLIVETMTLLYATRKEQNKVNVFGVKKMVTVGGMPRSKLEDGFFRIIRPIWPQFVENKNGIWGTSLNNLNCIFHPTPTILNLGRMEDPTQSFDYYIDGLTPSIAELLHVLDAEKVAVAKGLGYDIPSAVEWFHVGYGVEGDSIYEVVRANAHVYGGIKAPSFSKVEDKLSCRYVTEDVPTGLVPLSELGKLCGVPTPAIDTMISLASLMFKRDFRQGGRTLENLGLAGLTKEEVAKIGME